MQKTAKRLVIISLCLFTFGLLLYIGIYVLQRQKIYPDAEPLRDFNTIPITFFRILIAAIVIAIFSAVFFKNRDKPCKKVWIILFGILAGIFIFPCPAFLSIQMIAVAHLYGANGVVVVSFVNALYHFTDVFFTVSSVLMLISTVTSYCSIKNVNQKGEY